MKTAAIMTNHPGRNHAQRNTGNDTRTNGAGQRNMQTTDRTHNTNWLARWTLLTALTFSPAWALAQSDLVMTAVGTTATQFNTQGGYLYISDTLNNQGASASTATVRVGYYLSTDNIITPTDTFLGYRNASPLAAGASNSIASTYATIPAGLAPGTYYLGAIADDTGLEAETDETNNTLAAASTLAITLPDLVMTAVGSTATQVNTLGGYINISDTLKNQGPVASTVSNVRVGYYLSTDNIITPTDTLLGYRNVGTLAAGASSINTGYPYYANVPAGLAPGTYYIGAIADYNGLEAETDETNNALVSATSTLTVTLPDFVMSAVGSTVTQINTLGGYINVSDTLTNQGPVASTVNNVRIGYYLSTDNIITPADTLLGYRTVGTVAAGANSTNTGGSYANVPAGLALGTYYLGAIADYNGLQAETDETNNALTATSTLTVTLPDLVMSAVGTATTQVNTQGGYITVSDTLTNQGPVASTTSVRVGYYLSTDNIITTADTLLTYRLANPVAAGAGNSVAATSVPIPAGLTVGATYYLGAIADYSGLQAETDETNNALVSATSTLTVALSDLVMTAVGSTATQAAPGTYLTVSDTLKNQGPVASAATVRVGYYLSTDNVITPTDTLLGYRNANSVAAGASNINTGATYAYVPVGLATGTYYLGAIADYSGLEAETDETNNTLLSAGTTIAIGPDLVMTSVTTTSTAAAPGATLSIADTLKNRGASATGSGCRSIGYYLSADAAITPADTLIGSRQHCGALAANGTSNGTGTSATIPANLPIGTYYLGAIADSSGVEAETDETNNSLSGTAVQLTLLPDAPANVAGSGGNASATVTFSAPVNNGGTAITGYTVSSSPAGGVDSNAGTTGLSHLITGLTNGTAYTFTVTATNAAGTSAASAPSNSVTPATVPDAPLIGSAVARSTQATVTFSAPANNGGAAISGYTVTSSPAGGVDSNAGTLGLSHVITGLTNGTAYTFTVTATNSAGTGAASAASNSVIPSVAVPDAPANVIATGGVTQASVSFSASLNDGGSPVTGYTVSANPAGPTDSNAGSLNLSHVITGLVGGTTYTFTVTASNAAGTSAASMPSNSVTANSNLAQEYYIHADHLDTPRQITDTAGNVVWQWDNSDPFGNNVPNENPSGLGTFEQPLRFKGMVADKETGLFYNINRDYDPANGGRYIESDPIGLGGGVNTYVYVNGNPLSWSDPFGLRPLSDTEKNCLAPYIPQRDLDNADVHIGDMPWYAPKWATGITRGNDIYFREPSQTFDTPEDLGLLAHELVHVGQYANGMNWLSYFWASRHGYEKNPYEVDAYALGNEVTDKLRESDCACSAKK